MRNCFFVSLSLRSFESRYFSTPQTKFQHDSF